MQRRTTSYMIHAGMSLKFGFGLAAIGYPGGRRCSHIWTSSDGVETTKGCGARWAKVERK
eukprot:11062495-Prorocentrum_lima.AAC.1